MVVQGLEVNALRVDHMVAALQVVLMVVVPQEGHSVAVPQDQEVVSEKEEIAIGVVHPIENLLEKKEHLDQIAVQKDQEIENQVDSEENLNINQINCGFINQTNAIENIQYGN